MKKILFIAGIVSMTGCKKFLDVNTNPNTPTVTQSNFVFSNALNRSAVYMVGGPHITSGSWVGYYGHSTSFTGGGQEKTYVFTNGDFNYFDAVYDNLTDYQYVIDHAAADGVPYMVGPSRIMQVYMLQKLVDFYGDVPFSSSKAAGGTYSLTPTYDGAAGIYQALTTRLTDAVALINANLGSFPSSDVSDIVFNGNATNWKKFANSIKMRLIIRRSNVAGYTATTDIATLSADGLITTPVLCQPGFLKTAGKLNPYYANYGFSENDAPTGDFRKMNSVIVNWLKSSNDVFRLGRLCSVKGDNSNAGAFATPSTNSGDYAGVDLGGIGNNFLSANVSAMGREQIVLGQATRPVILMSDAEATFLQAEAIQRGWMPGSAQATYENAVHRAFQLAAGTYLTGSQAGGGTASATVAAADAAAATYLTSGLALADWAASPDKLRAIWVQKWVALCNMDGEEAWSEYRRTNSPTNPLGNCPTTPHSVATASAEPVRLFYPIRENNVNTANVPAGINVFTSRIFWDIN